MKDYVRWRLRGAPEKTVQFGNKHISEEVVDMICKEVYKRSKNLSYNEELIKMRQEYEHKLLYGGRKDFHKSPVESYEFMTIDFGKEDHAEKVADKVAKGLTIKGAGNSYMELATPLVQYLKGSGYRHGIYTNIKPSPLGELYRSTKKIAIDKIIGSIRRSVPGIGGTSFKISLPPWGDIEMQYSSVLDGPLKKIKV